MTEPKIAGVEEEPEVREKIATPFDRWLATQGIYSSRDSTGEYCVPTTRFAARAFEAGRGYGRGEFAAECDAKLKAGKK